MSRKSKAVLTFIEEYWDKYGFSPTYREIAAAMGGASTSNVKYHLGKLADEGYLKLHFNVPRGIVVIR